MKQAARQLGYWLMIPLALWVGGFWMGPKINFQMKCEDINTEKYLTCQAQGFGQKYRWSYGEYVFRPVRREIDGLKTYAWQPVLVRRLRSENDLRQVATDAYPIERR